MRGKMMIKKIIKCILQFILLPLWIVIGTICGFIQGIYIWFTGFQEKEQENV